MDNKRLLTLLTRYQDNSCTAEELQEIEQWYQALDSGNRPVQITDSFAEEMLQQFRKKVGSPIVPIYKRKLFRIAAAASIVLMLAAGSYFTFFNKSGTTTPDSPLTTNDFTAPSSSKAYITLSDGRKVYLEDLQNGTVATEGGIAINKNGDQIVYNNANAVEVKYNTLTVPKGSKPFKLLLADGSEMWLDAATTITYPNAFVGSQRNIEIITGQAYFEIAPQFIAGTHDKMPFVVKKGNAEVQVLGTHFNISAFDNEDLKVTLLEGSVKVSELTTNDSRLIKPGQQAIIQNSSFKIQNNIELDAVMAWKNGNFQFEGAGINEVMKQLARWYDVELEVRGNIKEHFGGTISREVNVSKVFEMLRLTGELNYKIEGRKIIVTP